jgi:hypothetical protein
MSAGKLSHTAATTRRGLNMPGQATSLFQDNLVIVFSDEVEEDSPDHDAYYLGEEDSINSNNNILCKKPSTKPCVVIQNQKWGYSSTLNSAKIHRLLTCSVHAKLSCSWKISLKDAKLDRF